MSPIRAITLDFAAATDVGCRRANNEDSFGYDAEQHIYVVCDGMGGSAAGEIASGMAVRALVETFARTGAEAASAGTAARAADMRLLSAIHAANHRVRRAALEHLALYSMGTTLVCACLDGGRMLIGNVGDSRAYLIRDGRCMQITEDHSFLEEQIRAGKMTSESASHSLLQSVITRAIGVADFVEPDLFSARVKNEDLFLLASDGLTRYASPQEIARLVGPDRDLQTACAALIERAKQMGGADNITCLILRVVEAEADEPDPQALVNPI
jgi:protein phosphatase